ncbi:hypothetical protein TARUN_2145 [Trichoderma arundinaceum]|uniref:Uncharacterized protein n=1 Tax=Trichoderma arundinaceum TaxID=490622 RepID=A0A395NW53_TRIAR|nr:hypothetical protein TARUN_2145 [Trichoderma arundinaceum]
MMPGMSIAALAASSLIGTASAASMYAFYPGPDKGVQLGMQDPKTGDIWISNCNTNINGAPLFPTDTPIVLPTKNRPKMGTSLAATGWWDSQKVVASIFWHAENGYIVNGFYNCNPETGALVQQGEYNISHTAQVKSVHNNTGLAVELLGSTAGYRVFYHDAEGQVNEMSYTQKTDWDYYGTVSQDPASGFALASAHSAANNISVVFPKSAKDIEVSRLNQDGKWHISTFPETVSNIPTNNTAPNKISINPKVAPKFSLPAWDGETKAMGVAIDNLYTRTVFYIGNDRKLYEAANVNFQWGMLPNQSRSVWPLADEANGEMAVTFNFQTNEAWIYYMSNSTLVQAYRGQDGKWTNHTVLPNTTPSNNDDGGSDNDGSNNGDDNNKSQPASTGLSTGAKAGIGIGVSVGAIGVGLLGLLFFLRRRRQQAAANAAATDKDQPINLGEYRTPSEQALYMADGMAAPAYTPQSAYDAHDPSKKSTPDPNMHPMHQAPLVEMEQPPMIYELPQSNYSYELPAESVEHR